MVSPKAIVGILEQMHFKSTGTLYRSYLPVAGTQIFIFSITKKNSQNKKWFWRKIGESGTLKNRFVNTSAQGIVQAKTGTLSSASALSGYMEHSEFPLVVFSIIVNNFLFDTVQAE